MEYHDLQKTRVADLRDMVKKLISEIDVPSGIFETKVFDLEPLRVCSRDESLRFQSGRGTKAFDLEVPRGTKAFTLHR